MDCGYGEVSIFMVVKNIKVLFYENNVDILCWCFYGLYDRCNSRLC